MKTRVKFSPKSMKENAPIYGDCKKIKQQKHFCLVYTTTKNPFLTQY